MTLLLADVLFGLVMENDDLLALAVLENFGVGDHAFNDGNKRTAYVVARLFLVLHGHDIGAPAVERVLVFERLGKGEMGQEELGKWMRGKESVKV